MWESVVVYEFVDELEFYDDYEARKQKFQTSEEFFEEQGRGIQWAFELLQ